MKTQHLIMIFGLIILSVRSYSQVFPSSQNISGIINTYTKVTAIGSPCSLSVTSTSGLAAGNKVLIIQMQGASIDASNSVNFGNVTAINTSGNYEFAVISSIAGLNVVLTRELVRTYDPANGSLQLVTVPQYNGGAVVTATLTAQDWNGTTGGVLVFESAALAMNAAIDVTGKGFRAGDEAGGNSWCEKTSFRSHLPMGNYDTTYTLGTVYITCAEVSSSDNPAAWSAVCSGAWRSAGNTGCGCNVVVPKCFNATINDQLTYASGQNFTCSGYTGFSASVIGSGEKGEGIIAMQPWFKAGRGKITNGGGGGNEHNGGGGGGSNYGTGGLGGRGRYVACGGLATGQGFGGVTLSPFYSTVQNKIFMGGGGGCGHANDGQHTIGSDGGGIVIIKATSVTSSGFAVRANGENNNNTPVTNPGGGYDGSGGGGGGGVVLLDIPVYASALTAEARGGKGSDNHYSGFSDDCYAPGGGGGGGVVWFSQGITPATVTTNVTGGASGTQLYATARSCYTASPEYGATAGTNGSVLYNWVMPAGTVNCTLPVDMIYFHAGLVQENVFLNWKTSSEMNNDYFLILRSTDTHHWEMIGKVQGAGTTFQTTDYSFYDEKAPVGIVYYKIRQVDHDGTFYDTHMKAVSLESNVSGIVQIFPNPLSKGNMLTMNYYSEREETISVNIFNVLGQIVFSGAYEFQKGMNTTEINPGEIAKGTYVLSVFPSEVNNSRMIVLY